MKPQASSVLSSRSSLHGGGGGFDDDPIDDQENNHHTQPTTSSHGGAGSGPSSSNQQQQPRAIVSISVRLEERKRMEALKRKINAKENVQHDMRSAVHQRARTIQRQQEQRYNQSVLLAEQAQYEQYQQHQQQRGRQPLKGGTHWDPLSGGGGGSVGPSVRTPSPNQFYGGGGGDPQKLQMERQQNIRPQQQAAQRQTYSQHIQQQQQQQAGIYEPQPLAPKNGAGTTGSGPGRSRSVDAAAQNRSRSMQSAGGGGAANPRTFQSPHLANNDSITYIPVASRLHTYGSAHRPGSGRSRSAGAVASGGEIATVGGRGPGSTARATECGVLRAYVEDVEQARRILKSESAHQRWSGGAGPTLRSPSRGPKDEPPALMKQERSASASALLSRSASGGGMQHRNHNNNTPTYKISARLKELAMTKGERAYKFNEEQRVKREKLMLENPTLNLQPHGQIPIQRRPHVGPSRRAVGAGSGGKMSAKLSLGLLAAHPGGTQPLPRRRTPSPDANLSPYTSEDEEEIYHAGGGPGQYQGYADPQHQHPPADFVYRADLGPYAKRPTTYAEQQQQPHGPHNPADSSRGSAVVDLSTIIADPTQSINNNNTTGNSTTSKTVEDVITTRSPSGASEQQHVPDDLMGVFQPKSSSVGQEQVAQPAFAVAPLPTHHNIFEVSPDTEDRSQRPPPASTMMGSEGQVSPVPFRTAALEPPRTMDQEPGGEEERDFHRESKHHHVRIADPPISPSGGGPTGGRSLAERTTVGRSVGKYPSHEELVTPQPQHPIPRQSPERPSLRDPAPHHRFPEPQGHTRTTDNSNLHSSGGSSRRFQRDDLFGGFGNSNKAGGEGGGEGVSEDLASRIVQRRMKQREASEERRSSSVTSAGMAGGGGGDPAAQILAQLRQNNNHFNH